MPVTKERDILLPDRVQLEEFTRKVLKFADDDLLIHNETGAINCAYGCPYRLWI